MHFGIAVIRDVVVLIVPDSALRIPQLGFQINAILGYPVIAALGEITLHRDGRVVVRHRNSKALTPRANLYMEGTKPLVAVGEGDRTDRYISSTAAPTRRC